MAKNTIKGLTIEIGGDTTQLGKALEDVNQKSRDLSSELGQINKLLKMDPGNADLLAQKQKVLAEAVSNTSQKLDTLKEAEKQVQKQFERGEVSEEQVRALKREIIETEKKLQGYERTVKETADEVENLGKETEDAKEENEELSDTLSNGVKVGLAAVAAGCAAAVAAIASSVEATAEYRREMGKLETAFTQAGHSAVAATETYEELQGILGETDQAVEAANFIAKLATDEKDLAKWTDICTGVFATFGASLPVEGLAEAANETAKVGQVTGPLADALNWAAAEGETFGVVLKENTEANEEWNAAVEAAASAEDFFNLALQECSTEQERQALIMDTLNGMYSDAADQYKETNKEVIRGNKATEKMTKVWAKVGSKAAPVVNTFREGVADLGEELVDLVKDTDVEDLTNSMEDGFGKLAEDTLPKFINSLKWIRDNFDKVKSVAAGAVAALVAYKTATIAAEISQKGLLATIKATTVAQTALNLAKNATPWGLVATAVAGVTAALVAYCIQAENAKSKVEVLTEEEKRLQRSAQEAADAFRDQQAATDESMSGTQAQMDHVTDLADELFRLADSSGKVEEADRTRAQFILNELNEALGTEYTMVDGVIQKYDELETSIYDVINAKTVNALLEAGNEEYVQAIQNEADALGRVQIAEKDYAAQLDAVTQKEAEAAAAREALNEKVANAKTEADYRMLASEAQWVSQLETDLEREKGILAEKETEYTEAAGTYGNYHNTVLSYEEAQMAAAEGNYARAKEILLDKGAVYGDYADTVNTETARALDALYKEAVDAGIAAARTKENFESGVDGYTAEMVTEAEQGYEEALNAYATAYDDAHGVGKDIGSGMADGMESKRTSLIGKIKNIVNGIIAAAREAADSHSPSRKMISFGEDMGEGTVVGLERKTKDILRTARDQVEETMGAYEQSANDWPLTTPTVATRTTAPAGTGNESLLAKLDGIYERLGRLQLYLDGDTVVGGLLDRIDRALGDKQLLSARGG